MKEVVLETTICPSEALINHELIIISRSELQYTYCFFFFQRENTSGAYTKVAN